MYSQRFSIRYMLIVLLIVGILPSISSVQAQTTLYATDLSTCVGDACYADWEAEVFGIEILRTTSSNMLLANEVGAQPGDRTDLGSVLTFDAGIAVEGDNSFLTRGFSVETLEGLDATDPADRSTFIFTEYTEYPDYVDALSVGADNPEMVGGGPFEFDSWRLSLTDASAGMNAFGIVFRNTRTEESGVGEYFALYSNDVLQDTVDLNSVFTSADKNFFIGITTDYAFDRIDFIENAGSDNIMIADFRFATVVPEPVSSTLFVIGAAALGFRRYRQTGNNS